MLLFSPPFSSLVSFVASGGTRGSLNYNSPFVVGTGPAVNVGIGTRAVIAYRYHNERKKARAPSLSERLLQSRHRESMLSIYSEYFILILLHDDLKACRVASHCDRPIPSADPTH